MGPTQQCPVTVAQEGEDKHSALTQNPYAEFSNNPISKRSRERKGKALLEAVLWTEYLCLPDTHVKY